VIGYVDNGTDPDADVSLVGPIASLERLVQQYGVDEIVVALPPNRREQLGRIIARGFGRPIQVKFAAELGDLLPERFELHRHGGRSYIGFAPAAPVSWLKRAFDLFFGTLIAIGIAPIVLAIALAIKLDSPGSVFYAQERVGKDGARFRMWKFRSMRQDADRLLEELRAKNEASGPLFKMRHDPRVTRVGRLLRRSSLDELPQLFNVLLGEMSLVGPRPPVPSEVAQYEDWQHGRLRAVPGMTGLWQVSGRSDVPFHDMVRLDLHYIRNWSLWLDLEIILRTIPAVIGKSGAY
jgi:exopolysaccharide biosynthesis polyprenyl glycosylphosphotransferase